MTAGRLAEVRVLVPAHSGQRLAAALQAEGAHALVAPAIAIAPPHDPAPLADALGRLAGGAFDWLAVTSATTVSALAEVELPAGTRVAAVGAATADALHAAGLRVDYAPSGEQSAAGMVAEWPSWGARVLIPQSSIAAPTLADGLRSRGFAVTVVTAYRTISATLPAAVVAATASGEVDAVILSSGSVARSIDLQLSPLPERMRVVCIGEPSAAAARELGMRVDAVAARPEPGAIVEALRETLQAPNGQDNRDE